MGICFSCFVKKVTHGVILAYMFEFNGLANVSKSSKKCQEKARERLQDATFEQRTKINLLWEE